MNALRHAVTASAAHLLPSAALAAAPAATQQGFVNAATIAAFGGVVCFVINAAPFIQPPFKQWATWLVLAGTALSLFRYFS